MLSKNTQHYQFTAFFPFLAYLYTKALKPFSARDADFPDSDNMLSFIWITIPTLGKVKRLFLILMGKSLSEFLHPCFIPRSLQFSVSSPLFWSYKKLTDAQPGW